MIFAGAIRGGDALEPISLVCKLMTVEGGRR
jgi:hypothetical protein